VFDPRRGQYPRAWLARIIRNIFLHFLRHWLDLWAARLLEVGLAGAVCIANLKRNRRVSTCWLKTAGCLLPWDKHARYSCVILYTFIRF
jgi:hypothetical protein